MCCISATHQQKLPFSQEHLDKIERIPSTIVEDEVTFCSFHSLNLIWFFKRNNKVLFFSAMFIIWKENNFLAACVFYVYLPIARFR